MGGWGCAFDPWNGLVRLWQDATLQVSLGLGVVARHSGTFNACSVAILLVSLLFLPTQYFSLFSFIFLFPFSPLFFSFLLLTSSLWPSTLAPYFHLLSFPPLILINHIVLPSFPFTSPLPLDSQCSHSPRVYMNASSCLILPLFPFPLLSSPTLSSRSGVYRWWLG